jgi:hypothetical protein
MLLIILEEIDKEANALMDTNSPFYGARQLVLGLTIVTLLQLPADVCCGKSSNPLVSTLNCCRQQGAKGCEGNKRRRKRPMAGEV